MATIERIEQSVDGYDIVCVLHNGLKHTFYTQKLPDDPQAWVDGLEADLQAAENQSNGSVLQALIADETISAVLDVLKRNMNFLMIDPGVQAMVANFIMWKDWDTLGSYLMLQVQLGRITEAQVLEFVQTMKDNGIDIALTTPEIA